MTSRGPKGGGSGTGHNAPWRGSLRANIRVPSVALSVSNFERLRRERNTVTEAAATAESETRRKMTALQREIERLRGLAEAAHERAKKSNKTSTEYKNALAAEAELREQLEEERAELSEAKQVLERNKKASNAKIKNLKGQINSLSGLVTESQTQLVQTKKNVRRKQLVAAAEKMKAANANAAARQARENSAAARAEANAARAAIKGATNFAAQKIAEERAKAAEANARVAAAAAAAAAAKARANQAEASGRNVAAARNKALAEKNRLEQAQRVARNLTNHVIAVARKGANAARASAAKARANAAKSGTAAAAARAEAETHKAAAAAARQAEAEARVARLEALNELSTALGNATAQKNARNASNAALAREKSARAKVNREILAAREALGRAQEETRKALQNRGELKKEKIASEEARLKANANAAKAREEASTARRNLTNARNASERVIAEARSRHANLEETIRKSQAKIAAAETALKNAEARAASRNEIARAHTALQAEHNRFKALTNNKLKNLKQQLNQTRSQSSRNAIEAMAESIQASQRLNALQKQLNETRSGSDEHRRAKEQVNAALQAEKNARAAANTEHQEHVRRLRETGAAIKAQANAAKARANAAEKRARNAENNARRQGTAAANAAARAARANANRAAANSRMASFNAATHISSLITGGIRNKIPFTTNMKTTGGAGGTSSATGGTVTFTPTITVGSSATNTAAILAQFMKTALPSMNAELLQHIKNALKSKKNGGANLSVTNKNTLMRELVNLMQRRELLKQRKMKNGNLNPFNTANAANVNGKIETTKQMLKLLGVNIPENRPPPVNKNNINKALNTANRFTRLQKLYELFRQTKKEDVARRTRLTREIRLVIAKLYGSNVNTSNALRNIINANRLVGRGVISTNVNKNLANALRILKNEAKSGGKKSGLRPKGGNGGYGGGGGYGGNKPPVVVGGGAPPISIQISNVGKVSNTGKVSNSGRVSNSGTTRSNNGTGTLGVSAPTSSGERIVSKSAESLIRQAGGSEAIEKGIQALRAANGNVTKAKAMSRLPNTTFTNIYALGGPVAAKKYVERRRRSSKRRVAGGKKRVTKKPKKYIKLTPYQFKRLTDHIKKNNLRKVLIKEITH